MRWTIAALVAGVIVAVPAGSAGAASSTASCGEVVATDLTLENDLVCINTDGLIVGRDNITIDLNGHTIECVAPDGYLGQCTGAGPLGVILEDPDPEVGIDTNGHSNVHVFGSGLFDPDGSGRVNGFDVGVRVIGGAEINIQNLRIAAQQAAVPAGAPVPAPQSIGILVHEISCPFPMKSIVHIGGGRSGENNVNGYNLGLWLRDADCVSVGWNTFQNARSGLLESHGILLEDSSHNNLHENGTTSNGDRGQFDSGIGLVGPNTVGNTVTANRVIQNFGDGISVTRGASGNQIDNNLMLFNGFELSGTVFFDAADGPTRGNSAAPTNFWNFNNQCLTQTTPNPPPGVCGSDELPS